MELLLEGSSSAHPVLRTEGSKWQREAAPKSVRLTFPGRVYIPSHSPFSLSKRSVNGGGRIPFVATPDTLAVPRGESVTDQARVAGWPAESRREVSFSES